MNKQAVEQRVADLNAQKEQVLANLNALVGAIQDCEYWLERLNKEKSDGQA